MAAPLLLGLPAKPDLYSNTESCVLLLPLPSMAHLLCKAGWGIWEEERMLLGQGWSSPCSSEGKPYGATVRQSPARNYHSGHIFWASSPLLPDSMSNMEG